MNRRWRRTGAALAVAGLMLGAAACGDDDDDAADDNPAEAGGDEQASGDNAAFCDGLVAFNTAVFQIQIDEESAPEDIEAAGAELTPLYDEVRENAPEDLQDTANELGDAIDALNEGDDEAFNADETFETYTGFVSDAIDECGFQTVDVTAVDYEFEGVPETIEAGTVAINLANEGEEEHEFIVFKKADGETRSATELLEDPAAQEEGPGEFAAATFAPPGEEAAGLAELEAGDYIAVCFIPVGGADDGPPHFTEGMVTEFTVG